MDSVLLLGGSERSKTQAVVTITVHDFERVTPGQVLALCVCVCLFVSVGGLRECSCVLVSVGSIKMQRETCKLK